MSGRQQDPEAEPVEVEQVDDAQRDQAERRSSLVPAMTADVGRTIFGNWICRIRLWRPVIDRVASLSVVLNHFQGRIATNRNSG